MAAATAPVGARRTLFAGALVGVSLFGDSYLYAVLPIAYPAAGLSLEAVGWLLSANRYIRLLTNPLAGAVGARLGWAGAFAGALWLASATTAAYGLLRGLWALLAARALWGLCWSFLRLGGMAAVLADSPTGRRGRLMGLFTGIFRLGSLVGVVAGGYLADLVGFHTTALLLAGATAAGAAVGSLPPALGGRWGAPARAAAPAPPAGGACGNWLPASRPEWAACLSAAVLHLVVSGIVTSTLGLLVRQRLGAQVALGPWLLGAATVSGLVLGSRWVIDLLLGPALGHWADRRGRGPVLAAATLVLVLGLLGLARVEGLWPLLLAAVLTFVAGTGAATALDAWAGDLAGRAPGRFLPAYNTWLDLGAATGPVAGYALAARLGLGATYLAGAGALLLAAGARAALTRR